MTAAAPIALRGGGPIRASRSLTGPERLGLVVLVAGLSAGLFAVTPLAGRADYLVFTVLAYAVTQTAVSFAVEGRRRAYDRLLSLGVHLAFAVALIPLVTVLSYTVVRGLKRFDGAFFSRSLNGIGPLNAGGGAYHAIVGTLEQVGIATLISVPLGLLTAIYVTEYGRGRLATAIRFTVDVMTGVPSIVTGLFVLAFWVLALGQGYSGFAAALALSILMLPVVMRSAEEMIRLVPDSLREASYALGVPKWRTILSIVLPTASAGITTGVMLAVARVTGETAPLLLTAGGISSINMNPFSGNQSGLGLYIFDQASSSGRGVIDRAWAGALTLIIIVLVLYALARLLTRRNSLVN